MKNNEMGYKQTDKNKPSRRKYIIASGFILLLITPVIIFILLSQNPKPDPASEKLFARLQQNNLIKIPITY